MGRKYNPPKVEVTEEEQLILNALDNTSAKIRFLYERRYATTHIRAILGIKYYQNVRNVIMNHIANKERKQRERERRQRSTEQERTEPS